MGRLMTKTSAATASHAGQQDQQVAQACVSASLSRGLQQEHHRAPLDLAMSAQVEQMDDDRQRGQRQGAQATAVPGTSSPGPPRRTAEQETGRERRRAVRRCEPMVIDGRLANRGDPSRSDTPARPPRTRGGSHLVRSAATPRLPDPRTASVDRSGNPIRRLPTDERPPHRVCGTAGAENSAPIPPGAQTGPRRSRPVPAGPSVPPPRARPRSAPFRPCA